MSRTSRPAIRWGVVVLGAVAAMAVGALVAVLIVHPFAPSNLSASRDATHVVISRQEFVDARPVQVRLTLGGARTVVSPVAGRVTSLSCSVGTPLASGGSALSVDGVPLLTLATSIPLWRDLPRGATGPDVTSLQATLAASGFAVSADRNRVGNQTIAAMRQLFTAVGATMSARNTISQSQILWVPSTTVPVSGCPLAVGQYLSAGDPVVQFPAGLVGARVVATPTHLAPGPRVLRIGSVSVPIDASDAVTDAASLAKIEATPEYATATGSSSGGSSSGGSSPTLNATDQLAKATVVTVVPPETLVGVSGTSACILSHGKPFPVTIAGSQLGESYVRFTGQTPTSVDLQPPASATCR